MRGKAKERLSHPTAKPKIIALLNRVFKSAGCTRIRNYL